MAIYSTFFLANDAELNTAFAGWKRPLDKPIERVARNPFTGEVILDQQTGKPRMALSWDPTDGAQDEPEEQPKPRGLLGTLKRLFRRDDDAPPRRTVAAIPGDYGEYLESRIPAFVQSAPHWCTKSILSIQLEAIATAIAVPTGQGFMQRPARIAPRNTEANLDLLPAELVDRLGTLSKVDRVTVAEMLAEDEDWHPASPRDIRDILRELRKLARQAKRTGRSVYLLTEW